MKRICFLKSMFHFRFEWFIVKVSLKLMAGGGQDSWRLSEICQKREFSDRPVSGWGQRFGEVFWLLKMKSRSRKECHQREEEGRCWSRMRGGERMRQESHKREEKTEWTRTEVIDLRLKTTAEKQNKPKQHLLFLTSGQITLPDVLQLVCENCIRLVNMIQGGWGSVLCWRYLRCIDEVLRDMV